MSGWIDGETIKKRLMDEAARDATRLGHKITSWVAMPNTEGTFLARCVVCHETASVMVRRFHAAPITGAAVYLRCRKRRAA
jgi:hypothetical protein